MAIPLPNLDDKTFAQLMEEAKAIIPRYSRDWTNFNPSDPGITLLELFAWINEMIIYRQNKITKETKWELLKLLTNAPKTAFVDVKVSNFDVDDEGKITEVIPDTIYTDYAGTRKYSYAQQYFQTNPNSAEGEEELFVRYYNIGINKVVSKDEEPGKYLEVKIPEKKTCVLGTANQVIPIFTADDKEHRPLIFHPDLMKSSTTHPYMNGLAPKIKFFTLEQRDNPVYQKAINSDGRAEWTFVPDLVGTSAGRHFTFDYHRRAIVFGDGVNGEIPPKGAFIEIHNLYLSEGESGQVPQNCEWYTDQTLMTPENKFVKGANPTKAQDGEDWFKGELGEFVDEEKLDAELLKAAIRYSLDFHREPFFRAVTKDDYEYHAMDAYTKTGDETNLMFQADKDLGVEKVWTVENFKVLASSDGEDIPNHISVFLMNEKILEELRQVYHVDEEEKHDTIVTSHKELTDAVFHNLNRRRLLTTMLHVGIPREKFVGIDVRVKLKPNKMQSLTEVKGSIREEIFKYFHPVDGGLNNKGRPIGQSLYKSEIYTLLEKMDVVDIVDSLTLYKEKTESGREYKVRDNSFFKGLPLFADFNYEASEVSLHEKGPMMRSDDVTITDPYASASIYLTASEQVPTKRDELLILHPAILNVSITL